tara:strand:+ start:1773 stop:2057 length:285 start_codon:yes stop_codon:yes gene_type:complete
LHFIDEENMISRGSLGQSVEVIIYSIPNSLMHLESIIKDKNNDIKIREFASLICAYHKGKDSIPVLSTIDNAESWYIPELINHLNEFEYFDPYG